MLSMTGYGNGSSIQPEGQVRARITSVNRKSLDLRFAMSREFFFLEPALRALVTQRINRGAVQLQVEITLNPDTSPRIEIDRAAIHTLLAKGKQLQQELSLAEPLQLRDLLGIPGIVSSKPAALPEKQLIAMACDATKQALTELRNMQNREGQELKNDLVQRCAVLTDLVQTVKQAAPRALNAYREKLHQRVAELLDEISLDDERLFKEVVFYADRSDITEELIRLGSHLQQMNELFNADGPVGRKLDFLIQEMGREINTIGSKSSDQTLAMAVIEFKTELERIREQIQNIE